MRPGFVYGCFRLVVLRQGEFIVIDDVALPKLPSAGMPRHLHRIHQIFNVVQRNAMVAIAENEVGLPSVNPSSATGSCLPGP